MRKERTYKLSLGEYNKLFIAFYPALCYFARKYTRDTEVAKDIAQEVFIKVWEERIEFDSPERIKSFLYTSVRNKSLDYLRSGQKRFIDHGEFPGLDVASDSHFLREVMIAETTHLVENAINSLPEKCARIINLSIREYTNEQIAEKLSLSVNTVKTQKRIAYQKLRPVLKNIFNLLFMLG